MTLLVLYTYSSSACTNRLITCGSTLEVEHLAVTFSQVSSKPFDRILYPNTRPFFESDIMAFSFCEEFGCRWEGKLDGSRTKNSALCVSVGVIEHGQQCCIAKYHMRVMSVTSGRPSSPDNRGSTGIHILPKRSTGDLFAPPTMGTAIHVMEERFAVALKSTTNLALPVFTIVNLSDGLQKYEWLAESLAGNWETAGVRA